MTACSLACFAAATLILHTFPPSEMERGVFFLFLKFNSYESASTNAMESKQMQLNPHKMKEKAKGTKSTRKRECANDTNFKQCSCKRQNWVNEKH